MHLSGGMKVVERGRKAGKEGGAARQEASVVTPPLSVPQRSWGHGGTEERGREGGREGGRTHLPEAAAIAALGSRMKEGAAALEQRAEEPREEESASSEVK
jgi:hypothetical protein